MQMCILEGKTYAELDPETATEAQLDGCILLTNNHGKELLAPGKASEYGEDKKIVTRIVNGKVRRRRRRRTQPHPDLHSRSFCCQRFVNGVDREKDADSRSTGTLHVIMCCKISSVEDQGTCRWERTVCCTQWGCGGGRGSNPAPYIHVERFFPEKDVPGVQKARNVRHLVALLSLHVVSLLTAIDYRECLTLLPSGSVLTMR